MKTRLIVSVCLAGLMAASVHAQSSEDMQRARRLRAEAAYLEIKGESAKALEQYEESLKFYQDATIAEKVAALKGMAGTAAAPSATRELAGEVYSKLDLDAFMLYYMNAESLIGPVREDLNAMLTAMAEAAADDDAMADTAERVTGTIDPLLDWLGLYSIRAAGVSVAPLDGHVSRVKTYVVRDPAASDRVLWRLAGKSGDLSLAKYLTADTVMATAGHLGPGNLWAIVREGLGKFAPEVLGMLDEQIEGLQMSMGINANELVSSLADGAVLALTLSDTTKVMIPISEEQQVEIPEPGLLLGFRARDASVQNMVLGLLRDSGMPVMEKAVGEQMLYSVNMPLPLPFTIQPAMMTHNGVLFISSSPSLIERAISSYDNGGALLKSAAFKAAIGEMPGTISALGYVGERFYKHYVEVFSQIMASDDDYAGLEPLMSHLTAMFQKEANNYYASYEVADQDSVLVVTRMKTPTANPLANSLSSMISALSALGISAAQKAQEQAVLMTCMMNQNNISSAKAAWAIDAGAEGDAQPTQEDLLPYIYTEEWPVCPAGGEYIIGTLEEEVRCTVDAHNFSEPEYDWGEYEEEGETSWDTEYEDIDYETIEYEEY